MFTQGDANLERGLYLQIPSLSVDSTLNMSMSKVEWGVMLDKSNLYGVNQRSPRLSRVLRSASPIRMGLIKRV